MKGRTFVIGFFTLALAISGGAVALNKYFVGDRATLQAKLQAENQTMIAGLRKRIEQLSARENNTPQEKGELEALTKRLDEAAAMDATKYQQVGQALSEVDVAVMILERKGK